jgi:hypothetical protein
MSNPGPRLAVDEGAAAVTEFEVNWCSVISTMLSTVDFFLHLLPLLFFLFFIFLL